MKIKCKNCNEKLKKDYSFCPSCGTKIRKKEEDYGLLGRNDSIKKEKNSLLGGISDKIMMKMIGSAMKMIEKEFEKEIKEPKEQNNPSGLRLMVNGKEIFNNVPENKKEKNLKKLPIEFSKENLKKWAILKKDEPKTNLKRLGDKIFYELDVPGVESIKDVSIMNLENSLEVKAIAKDKAYQKNIQIDLPLSKYTLLKGRLILEILAK